MIMPCGSGKSLAAYWIAEKLAAKRILIAVPSLALIRQTLDVWARESVANGWEIDWIVICSEKTIAGSDRDDAAVSVQDLGVEVWTDVEKISIFLRKRRRNRATVVFTTYQSGRITAEASRLAGIRFDLGIMDEAHKTVGKRDSLFAHLLFDENIRIRKRIFMTATERRYYGKSDNIASMDDPKLYGGTFELLTFKEALEVKPPILSDYTICTIGVHRDDIAELIKRNLFVHPDKGRWDEDVEAQMLASVIALRKAMTKYGIKHAVSFHNTIRRASEFHSVQASFSEAFPQYGNLDAFHVRGSMATGARKRQIDEFVDSARSLITNARCLTEGVDVPDIDAVVFADPRKSTVDIVQAVGRALRPAEGKQRGYVIVPVLLDGDEESLKQSAYDAILTTLRALASNDDRIIDYFRTISQGRKPKGKIIDMDFEFPEGVMIDADEFIRSVELQAWSRLAKLSWMPFAEARVFMHEVGLNNYLEWVTWYTKGIPGKPPKPADIPSTPPATYKKEWTSWGDFLGTGRAATKEAKFLPYCDAENFVHSLGLKSQSEYKLYCRNKLRGHGKKPDSIPSNPARTYAGKGWVDWYQWLGTDQPSAKMPFKKARAIARKQKLKSQREWYEWVKSGRRPSGMPHSPDSAYKNEGWKDWGDWLGTGTVAPQKLHEQWLDYDQANKFVIALGLKSVAEWNAYVAGDMPRLPELPPTIPRSPEAVYEDAGWQGMPKWLGTERISPKDRKYRPFKAARSFARSLCLSSRSAWRNYAAGRIPTLQDIPPDIPHSPAHCYMNKGWTSWPDWLGTDAKRKK